MNNVKKNLTFGSNRLYHFIFINIEEESFMMRGNRRSCN